jgi:uncharacterized protein YozE (UPF0346 family)
MYNFSCKIARPVIHLCFVREFLKGWHLIKVFNKFLTFLWLVPSLFFWVETEKEWYIINVFYLSKSRILHHEGLHRFAFSIYKSLSFPKVTTLYIKVMCVFLSMWEAYAIKIICAYHMLILNIIWQALHCQLQVLCLTV